MTLSFHLIPPLPAYRLDPRGDLGDTADVTEEVDLSIPRRCIPQFLQTFLPPLPLLLLADVNVLTELRLLLLLRTDRFFCLFGLPSVCSK